MVSDTVLALDLGSTLIKAAFVDPTGVVLALERAAAPELDARGRFDAEEYWQQCCVALRKLVHASPDHARRLVALSATNQRATTVPITENAASPWPAYSWMAPNECQAHRDLIQDLGAERFARITRLAPNPVFALEKILKFKTEMPAETFARTRFVVLHDFILFKLGARDFFCDPSNANMMGLMDSRRLSWSEPIVESIPLTMQQLPIIVPTGTPIGSLRASVASTLGLAEGIPIIAGCADQQGAFFGAGDPTSGDWILSTGTAALLMCSIDSPPDIPPSGLLISTHVLPERWILEGFQSSFGATFRWAAQNLGCASESEFEAWARRSEPGAGGVVFFPHLSGIASPDFRPEARGAFVGLSQNTNRNDLARAVFEGLAMETRRVFESIAPHCPQAAARTPVVRLVGGMGRSRFLVDLLANVCRARIEIVVQSEASLAAAAAAALTGTGRHSSLRNAGRAIDLGVKDEVFEPTRPDRYDAVYSDYVARLGALSTTHL